MFVTHPPVAERVSRLRAMTPGQLWGPQTCETRLIGGLPPSELCGRCWLYQRR